MRIFYKIQEAYRRLINPEPMTCARRTECVRDCQVHPICIENRKSNLDYWFRTKGQMRWGRYCCSYCGGLKPSEVLDLIESGEATDLESTDKYYKFYLHAKNKTWKFYMPHFNREQFEAVIAAAKKRDILNAWAKSFRK